MQPRYVDERQQRRTQLLVLGGIAAGLLAFAGILLFVVYSLTDEDQRQRTFVDATRKPPDTTSRGFPDQGNVHLQSPNQPHAAYNSDPPTSGWHMENLGPDGFQEQQVQKELLLHNLEDGGVVIYYRPDLPADQKERLRTLVESEGNKVTAAPYPGLKFPIVATAWTRMDELPAYDEIRLRNFIEAYRGIDHHKRS